MRVSKEDFEATKFLGGVVGAKHPFLKRIAMVSQEERELIGYAECLKIIIKNQKLIEKLDNENLQDKDLEQFLTKIFEPLLEKIGESKFKMGEISHLACKIGSTKRRYKQELPEF